MDNRPEEAKKDDVHFSTIVATANAVNWLEKPKEEWRAFPVLNQYESFTCGANALAKANGIAFHSKFGSYIPFSRAHIYQRRLNVGLPGMALYDMFRVASEGITLEAIVKSPLKTDADHDNAVIESWMKKEGETWKVSGGVYLNNDIDTIASVIQTTGKGVILLTYFLAGEVSKEIPYIVNSTLTQWDAIALRHYWVAVDYTLYKGQKCLIIEDSAHFGGLNRRIVTEDWVNKRVVGAGYPMNFSFQEKVGNKPTYDGMTVISAQKCLRYEGLFPTNVDYFESVGPTTRKALAAFQSRYGLTVNGAIDAPTRNKLNQLYP